MGETPRRRRMMGHIRGLRNPDQAVASRAEANLIRYYLADVYEEALAACDDPSPFVRFRAVWILAHAKDLRGYETIVRLTTDPDEAVRFDAIVALGVLKDKRGVNILISLLSEEESGFPSVMALERLGPAIIEALRPLLSSETAIVRHRAMTLIGRYAGQARDAELMEVIRPCLSDPDPVVRVDCECLFSEFLAFRLV